MLEKDTGMAHSGGSVSAKRVLITGINGFTGRYMQAVLQGKGYQVFGTMAGGSASAVSSVATPANTFTMDLCNADNVAMVVQQVQPHYVVHLAALSFVGHGDANGFYSVNLAGTRNLLAALAGLSEKPRCVLLASSANVYGNAQEGVLAESAAVAPANDYAVSKLAMEYMAKLWQQELPIVITRPFNYTGQGQEEKFLIPKIVRHFRDRAAVIELGNLDVWRDFSDVRALVQAYAGLLEQPAAIGKTVNICSGMALSLREVIAMCETISGHSLDVRVNPAFVRANEVKTLCGNPALLQSLLPGWQPMAFEQTLRWMLED